MVAELDHGIYKINPGIYTTSPARNPLGSCKRNPRAIVKKLPSAKGGAT